MRSQSPFAEPLEPRRHLAADFFTLGRTGTLTLIGTPADDRFVLTETGDGEFIRIAYGDEADQVVKPAVVRIVFEGGAGDDFVQIDTRESDKTTLMGGDGLDTLIGGAYFDLIFGGSGADLLKGGNQRDTIHGDGGNDRIFGNAFNDELYGGAGNDKINSGPGDDYINAGRGDDTVSSAGGADTIFGGAGTDTGLDLADLSVEPDGVEVL